MPIDHREIRFEDAIEQYLLDNGYEKGVGHQLDAEHPDGFDAKRAIWPKAVTDFLKATQPEVWDSLENLHGEDTARIVLDDLCRSLDSQGLLAVLRHGFKCYGKRLQMAFFAPAHAMNPETQRLYKANQLDVVRQLHFSDAEPGKSLDLALALNGLPLATAELKNQNSGQTVEHAKQQYRDDRDPKEKLFAFKQRAVVHFAVDTDAVAMATKLDGKKTFFLPLNRGDGLGAGNPDNPNGYKTEYLWQGIWQRDAWLDIFARFVFLESKETKVGGKKVRKETMIFPRYHQLDAVSKLEADAKQKGPGNNYLVQHSAGSGKSNSIGWLAHRLASLHDAKDGKVFDSVIVVTDRVVLDRQLQDTIYQLEHKQGVVQKIDESHKSAQLAAALDAGTPIIIVTIQTFPFVTEKLSKQKDRKYAVIIDEAHSSASGETATELKAVLAAEQIREKARAEAEQKGLADYEEEILRTMAKRGRQPNISFFAFTATPKYKTLEVFGGRDVSGKPTPFHLYSMRQAIEEGFIHDVLANYTTYKTYHRLLKSIEEDPQVEKRKAAQALARFMSLHPHNIAQKTEVMLEHFRAHTRHKIGGRAKAMVVTSSRLHAVRYKQEFDKQIAEKGYDDVRTLVAFSGTVEDPDVSGKSYTEPEMNPDPETGNPIKEKQLPEKFAGPEFQVLIVAEKYQTGFDQPLLHTMYVDKRLAGIQAVQTLSRLNRTCSGKEDTFVLDFVNSREEIYEAFQPYYERTDVGEEADPHQLYELQAKIEEQHIIHASDVEAFCKVFFQAKAVQSKSDHAKLQATLDPAVTRFKELDEEEQEEFRGLLGAFRNLYAFLSQVIPFQDSELEKLYAYARFLLTKLPRRESGPRYQFDDEVTLKFYRLQKISDGSIELDKGKGGEVGGPTAVGTSLGESPEVELSTLIELVNERFGTDFTKADELFFNQIQEEAVNDEDIREAAKANTLDNFRFVFDKALENFFIDRMEQNEELFAKYMNDPAFQELVKRHLRERVYGQIRDEDAA
ncbi:DEAD/DEAH box helicase family protein [Aeoliella sp. ICT_H6.2]|uniref:DEAD/DEAH box helicase family protein n=1 Tax=Aeoliella straminimaris TaxID=2954799 RepID=A0A9X2F7Y8_9BACT|nr:DEAD/DEAH box helicase family protein [Aeoliella straminimaris]MCO6043338.1 DEAD/DEAH box helicase family protein [Aeoliella straminimaris]